MAGLDGPPAAGALAPDPIVRLVIAEAIEAIIGNSSFNLEADIERAAFR